MRFIRYAAVSGIATAVGLTTLAVLVGLGGWPAGWANVVATALGTVPSFELNRRWVWRGRGGRATARKATLFVGYAFVELVASSVAVRTAAVTTAALGWPRGVRTLADLAANAATYGALWAGQYLLCDRLLFRRTGTATREVASRCGSGAGGIR